MERYSAAAAMNPHEEAVNVPPQAYPFHRSLHSVRKAPAKPWKKPTAPQPPNPTRVYKVEPINFRELVQKLTGRRLGCHPPPAGSRRRPLRRSSSRRQTRSTAISAVITTRRLRGYSSFIYRVQGADV
ncbi:hypothetical protein NL676_022799 [Syzygium grande]|nr:hypothetical protein NL676_022799 [Syzygium grande]